MSFLQLRLLFGLPGIAPLEKVLNFGSGTDLFSGLGLSRGCLQL
jgi:hypothetical protein